ncbi:Lrp/AsnC family transcriptional regulator [Bosea sp. ASV33]|uniref:Lrp/AsnC family transcriptional regulator n=1 Tax=Bosea sp. ASV33 TaxID=2795106 RepID=UPI0018ED6245|nr:Lrp/AsnC family transcriptional regulator [Bosea sp. ASV33]
MDGIDRKILAVLQSNAEVTLSDLAKRVALSQTPCWNRIQKLEKNGTLLKRVALLDPDKLGLRLTVFVQIETGDHSASWLENFARIVSAMPEVMEFYRMAGEVDYLLRVVVPDLEAYEFFAERLADSVQLRKLTPLFTSERIKSTTAYFTQYSAQAR